MKQGIPNHHRGVRSGEDEKTREREDETNCQGDLIIEPPKTLTPLAPLIRGEGRGTFDAAILELRLGHTECA